MEKNLFGLSLNQLNDLMKELGFPSYRADQLFEWLHKKQIDTWEEMSNIPKKLKSTLQENGYQLMLPTLVSKHISTDGQTIKCLFSLYDGYTVETVLMNYARDNSRDRRTVCVSSQVGCAMGCPFCATGHQGFYRNLDVSEIVGQVILMNKLVRQKDPIEQVTNLVYMGMGEPLNNYNHVLASVRLLSDAHGLNIGLRRMTISTCGIVPKIYALAAEGLPVTLAVSLHTADNKKRDKLVPINEKYPLASLLKACRYYYEQTKRRITFEYALIAGENDQPSDIIDLQRLLKGLNCHVNIIPLNVVSHAPYKTSLEAERFVEQLKKYHVEAFIREEKGLEIDAACGQLKANEGEKHEYFLDE